MRVAPELRTRSRGPRLGQHANTLKCTGKTTLEVLDGTLLERQSGMRALEPVLVHVTREEEDHDWNRVARRGREWQDIVGNNDRTCGVPSGEAERQAHYLLVTEDGRAWNAARVDAHFDAAGPTAVPRSLVRLDLVDLRRFRLLVLVGFLVHRLLGVREGSCARARRTE